MNLYARCTVIMQMEQTWDFFLCCRCQTAHSMQLKLSIKQHDKSG